METILIQSKRADIIDNAIKICEDNLPFMNECKDKRQLVVLTLMDNMDYCKDLIAYKESMGNYGGFKGDLSHDILGLYNKDEHFVPRISMPF